MKDGYLKSDNDIRQVHLPENIEDSYFVKNGSVVYLSILSDAGLEYIEKPDHGKYLAKEKIHII